MQKSHVCWKRVGPKGAMVCGYEELKAMRLDVTDMRCRANGECPRVVHYHVAAEISAKWRRTRKLACI
jgi:hypothetical protein